MSWQPPTEEREIELKQMVADPRYQPGTPQFDPLLRRKVDAAFRETYNGMPAPADRQLDARGGMGRKR